MTILSRAVYAHTRYVQCVNQLILIGTFISEDISLVIGTEIQADCTNLTESLRVRN